MKTVFKGDRGKHERITESVLMVARLEMAQKRFGVYERQSRVAFRVCL
jgi:hypothetical protein